MQQLGSAAKRHQLRVRLPLQDGAGEGFRGVLWPC